MFCEKFATVHLLASSVHRKPIKIINNIYQYHEGYCYNEYFIVNYNCNGDTIEDSPYTLALIQVVI